MCLSKPVKQNGTFTETPKGIGKGLCWLTLGSKLVLPHLEVDFCTRAES